MFKISASSFDKIAKEKKDNSFGKAMIGGVVGDLVIGTPVTIGAMKAWDKWGQKPYNKKIAKPAKKLLKKIFQR